MMRTTLRAHLAWMSLATILWVVGSGSASLWAQGAPPPAVEAPDEQPLPDEAGVPGDEPLIDEPEADGSAPAAPFGSTTASPSSSAMPPAAIAGMMSVFLVFYFGMIGLAILIGVGGLVLSCLAIYDCARRDFPDPNTRAMWCLLIALTRLLGAIIYYFVIYRSGDPPLQRAYDPGTPPPSPMSG